MTANLIEIKLLLLTSVTILGKKVIVNQQKHMHILNMLGKKIKENLEDPFYSQNLVLL